MKIAICVDGSKVAEDLFEWYCREFHRSDNQVEILHVGDEPKLPHVIGYEKAIFPQKDFDRSVAKCKAKAQEVKNKFIDIANSYNVNCQFLTLTEGGESPGEILVKYLDNKPVDMVAVGTRGLGTLRRTILGSVSDYLVHHSPCPVIVHRH